MLVLEGNTYFDGRLRKLCVGVDDGKIVTVKKIIKGDEHFDFGDKLILPAGIDIHVHFREPGFEYKEDFGTGTMAAAFGGISCVVDMPNTNPPTVGIMDLKSKINIARRKAYVDFGLNAALTRESVIGDLSKFVTGYKLYFSASTAADSIALNDEAVIRKLIPEITNANRIISGHCEDERLFNKGVPQNLRQLLASHPPSSELEAMKRFLSCGISKSRLHVCHVSSRETVESIRTAREDRHVTFEVTPHHLLFNAKAGLGSLGKVNPPLRNEEDQVALWQALKNGVIDIIASDHAPHSIDEKKDFETAPCGLPGVETMYPLMLLQVRRGRIGLERLVNAISEKPGELFGLNKGKIAVGRDADLIVVNMKNIEKIHTERLHSKCGWTPYEKHDAIFPLLTMVRGEIIVRDTEMNGKQGFGRYVS